MPLKIYKIPDYNYAAQALQFHRLCHILSQLFAKSEEPCVAIANYQVQGVMADAIVIMPSSIIAFAFKDCGGNVVTSEANSWSSGGSVIAGGNMGKNPFVEARIMRNRIAMAVSKMVDNRTTNVDVVVAFSKPSTIDDSSLSEQTKQWLTIADCNTLTLVLSRLSQRPQLVSPDRIQSIANKLGISQFDISLNDKGNGAYQGIYAPDVATDFFDQILSLPAKMDIMQEYRQLSQIFHQAVDDRLTNNNLKFSGFYAKVDYLLSEYKEKMIDDSLAKCINGFRIRTRRLRPRGDNKNVDMSGAVSDKELCQAVEQDVAALAKFIAMIYGTMVPEELNRRFPYVKEAYYRPLYKNGDVIRVVVDRWNQSYIAATNSETAEFVNVYYRKDNNQYALGDHGYLKDILHKGDELNLVMPRVEGNIIYPTAIIYNPDHLVDVSSLAACFSEHEVATPYAYMIKKLSPAVNSEAIMLGNFAGQILDDEVYHVSRSYENSLSAFCAKNAVNLAVCPLSKDFKQKAEEQKRNIHHALFHTLAESSAKPCQADGKNTILEPSFFSETLGLQARMDLMQKDMTMLMEQKSGSAAYNPSDPATPKLRPDHYVQALLYRAILRYNYGVRYNSFHTYMLYSKYQNSLLDIATAPNLLFDALKLRNMVVWMEQMLSKGGFRMLESLTPEHIYPNEGGYAWTHFIRPRLEEVLDQVHNASSLERDYYYRFLTFIQNEQILSKVGSRTKEDSGFAATWNSTLDEKRNAGNIYCNLRINPLSNRQDGRVEEVEFLFLEQQKQDMSNFRQGDVVFFYSYDPRNIEEPNPTKHYVFRGTLSDNPDANSVKVLLRNPQTTSQVFDGDVWAIEHDFMESSYRSLFQGVQLFLTAPKQRRDLLMLQRKPDVDKSKTLIGDYTNNEHTEFNDLVLRVKQAKDLFLIIGPPGTGKTSFGMLNVLKEELLEDDSNVLLLSFTNRAVDEMCSKLVEESIDFIRLGSEPGCSEKYRSHLLNRRAEKCNDGNEIRQMIMQSRVFCGTTTAFNSNISLLAIKQFSLAIVDEASQILEPQILGLLSQKMDGTEDCSIKKFVLIGDEKQLPAVVQQQEVESRVIEPRLRDINLTDCRLSLFERLIKTYRPTGENNEYSYMLTRQGRMHQDIALFPNYAFYQNKLIPVPLSHQKESTPTLGNGDNGLDNLLRMRRLAFVTYPYDGDTSEYDVSDKVNVVEAKMIAAAVYHIYKLNEKEFDVTRTVGVIVPYRNQISTIRGEIDRYGIDLLHDIMIDTVERYQGSQCENIIYGFTIRKYYQLNFLTSNQYVDSTSGEIIDRKLNVAMTRAMKHLIMIGDARLLKENIIFYKLMEYAKNRQSYFEIAPMDFIDGNFDVAAVDMSANIMMPNFGDANEGFKRVYAEQVTMPIKADNDTVLPQLVMGNKAETNMALIDYGRINFSSSKFCQTDKEDKSGLRALRCFSAKELVLMYCYYLMPQYYVQAKTMYEESRGWLANEIVNLHNNIRYIDMGCGPATGGLAFMDVYNNDVTLLDYYGIDVSDEMLNMAAQLLKGSYGDRVEMHRMSNMANINTDDWNLSVSQPSVVIFNFAYFFSNVSPAFSESLANQIAKIVEQNRHNKYVFFIQPGDKEDDAKSYKVFKNMLADKVCLRPVAASTSFHAYLSSY